MTGASLLVLIRDHMTFCMLIICFHGSRTGASYYLQWHSLLLIWKTCYLNTSCYFCRCKQPASIVVEMDRMLRPGGWAIIRDKVEILDPLEGIFKSLHWDIRMTYSQQKEGILCAQKTTWRP